MAFAQADVLPPHAIVDSKSRNAGPLIDAGSSKEQNRMLIVREVESRQMVCGGKLLIDFAEPAIMIQCVGWHAQIEILRLRPRHKSEQRFGLRDTVCLDGCALVARGHSGCSRVSLAPAESEIRNKKERPVRLHGSAQVHVEVVAIPLRLPQRAIG